MSERPKVKIIVDTNVLISGLYFGGFPGEILKYIQIGLFSPYASEEIIDEYLEVVKRLSEKNHQSDEFVLKAFLSKLSVIKTKSSLEICRDKDDDKFINCAIDAKAIYIVSGDEDLLVLKSVENIEIVTAKELCERVKIID